MKRGTHTPLFLVHALLISRTVLLERYRWTHFPQISCRHLLLCRLRAAALARILSMAVNPSPCSWWAGSTSANQLREREFCLADSFWCSLTRRDSMLSRISRISVTSCGGEPGGSQREDEDLGRTAWLASWLLRFMISWNFLLRSATRLNTWASRRFWGETTDRE